LQFRIIYKELLQNFGLVLVAIAFVCSIVLADAQSVAITIFVISIVDANILGTIFYWGLDINSITAVNVIMAVGLVVDYSAHVVHNFSLQTPAENGSSADGSTADSTLCWEQWEVGSRSSQCSQRSQHRNTRVIMTLREIGPSVLMGGLTSFLGILPLAAATSHPFRVFFKMFLGIIVFGMTHGLVLVPVLLSLPLSWDRSSTSTTVKQKQKPPVAVAEMSLIPT
jgi:predicted RND superfamily exporter protein